MVFANSIYVTSALIHTPWPWLNFRSIFKEEPTTHPGVFHSHQEYFPGPVPLSIITIRLSSLLAVDSLEVALSFMSRWQGPTNRIYKKDPEPMYEKRGDGNGMPETKRDPRASADWMAHNIKNRIYEWNLGMRHHHPWLMPGQFLCHCIGYRHSFIHSFFHWVGLVGLTEVLVVPGKD